MARSFTARFETFALSLMAGSTMPLPVGIVTRSAPPNGEDYALSPDRLRGGRERPHQPSPILITYTLVQNISLFLLLSPGGCDDLSIA